MRTITKSIILFVALFFCTITVQNVKAQTALDTSYLYLSVKYYTGWGSFIDMPEFASDDGIMVGGGASDRPEMHEIVRFEFNASNTSFEQLWNRNYHGIYYANKAIFTDGATGVELAEAKFLRAYFHFEALKAFGQVPVHTQLVEMDTYLEQSSYEDVFSAIVTDLEAAYPELPLKSELSTDEKHKITKGAAQALLAKAYIFMASPYYNLGQDNYEKALNILFEITGSREYELNEDYAALWTSEAEFGSESVFEIEYGRGEYNGEEYWSNALGSYGDIWVQANGPRLSSAGDTLILGWGLRMISNDLGTAYTNAADSIRKHATMLAEWQVIDMGLEINERNEYYSGLFPKKRISWKHLNPDGQLWGWAINQSIIRFSDIKLMIAEARYFMGDEVKALEELNIVRARVGLAPLTSTGDQLLADIKLERRLELAGEGHRFYDVVRWADGADVLGGLGFVAGENEHFTIPETVNLGGVSASFDKVDDIQIYPMPFNSIVEVNLNNQVIKQLTVIDLSGKQVKHFNTNGEKLVKLDLSSLNNGVYIMQIKTDKGIVNKKIVKK